MSLSETPEFKRYAEEHAKLDALKIPRNAGPFNLGLQTRYYLSNTPPAQWRLFVVIDKSKDYPNHISVRQWILGMPGDVELFDSVHEAREWIVKTFQKPDERMVRLSPDAKDDPVILEMWR